MKFKMKKFTLIKFVTLFLILVSFIKATEFEILNERVKLYSDQLSINGVKHKDKGSIYAYAYMYNDKVKIKVATSNGNKFPYNAQFAVFKNKFSKSTQLITSSNMKGKSYEYVTFSPIEADLYVLLGTQNKDGSKKYGFFINTPIKIRKKASIPYIKSLNRTHFNATYNIQDLRIYGSNFTSKTFVYIDWGEGWKRQSSRYTHFINSGEIKFDLRTTTQGSGVWKVKVKDSSYYSNYVTFTVGNQINHKPTLYTVSNPPTQIEVGKYAKFKLKAYDEDGDLHLIEVDWNDGNGGSSEVDSKQVTNNQAVTFSRRFTKPGTYTITATAYDKDTSIQSSPQSWTIKVNSKPQPLPLTLSLYTLPNPAKINTSVTFYAQLNRTLKNNEQAYISINGRSGQYKMQCFDKLCSYTTKITHSGKHRKFTVTIKNNSTTLVTQDGYYDISEGKPEFSIKDFWIADTAKYYAEDNPNFDTQFKIENTGTEEVTFNGAKIEALFQSNHQTYICWQTLNDILVKAHQIYKSGIKKCKLPYSGQYTITLKLLRNGQWKKYVPSQYFYLKSKIDTNIKPIITKITTSSNKLKVGDEFKVNVWAKDPDGIIKEIDVNWGDRTTISSKQGNSQTLQFNASHIYSKPGIYTWTTTAYDNWVTQDTTKDKRKSKSLMRKGTVYVFDESYYKTPILNPINASSIKAAYGTQTLTLTGSNFSKFSKIYWQNGSAKGYITHIRYINSNKIIVHFITTPSGYGTWKFNVVNGTRWSNTQSFYVKKPNKAPTIYNQTGKSTIDILSGTKLIIKIMAKDSNLNSICYNYNKGKEHCIKANGNEVKSFTFYPKYRASNKDYSIDTITFRAKDKEGATSIPIYINIKVFDNTQYHYGFINDKQIQKAGQCGGKYTILKNNSVNTATGAEMFSLNLLKVQGLHTIAAVLSYNSLLLTDNSISRGWNHNYGISAYLEFLDKEKSAIRVHWNDGNYNDFNLTKPNIYTSNDTVTKFSEITKDNNGTYTLKLPNQTIYHFYENGFIKDIQNHLGQGINIIFDINGSVSRVIDPISGVALEYLYNDNGKLSKIIDSQLHREVNFYYNEKGYLSHLTLPENIEYYFTYNELGQMTQFSYGDGTKHFTNTYLENGLIATEDDGRDDNHIFTYTFDRTQEGIIKTIYTNGEGKSTTYIYDAKDFLLKKVINAKGEIELVNEYDPKTKLLVKTTNAKNQTTTFTYDNKGRLIQKIYPNKLIQKYEYDKNDNLISETKILSNKTTLQTTYTYGKNNELLSKTLPNGNTYRYKYNQNNQLIEKTTPSGAKTTYTYQKGRLSKVTYPNGGSVVYRYDEAGRLIEETKEPLGATTTYQYDDADRLIAITDPMGNTIHYGYDMRGNKIYTIDAKGYMTKYLYDANNNLIKTIYPDNTETTYSYDGEDRIKTITYANGATEKFEYDALGRVIKHIDAMGNFVEFTYDGLGSVLQKIDREGNLIAAYKYDTMQNVIEAVDYFNNKTTNTYNQLGLLEKTIDPLGRVSRFKYDKLGRLTQAIDALNGISKQSFDADGNQKSFTGPNNNTTELKHDKAGNLTEIKTASGSTTKYVYDANGLLIKEINGRGQVRTYSYNKNGQVVTVKDDAGTITYTYDANGNPTTISENGITIKMAYDEMNRLIGYNDGRGNKLAYSYDSVGNLKSITYPDGKTVTYDYNKANQLIKVTDWNNRTTTYSYDALGRLVKRVYPNGATLTRVYDKGGRLIHQKEFLKNNRISEYIYEYDKVGNIVKEKVYPQLSPKVLASMQMTYTKGNLLKEANKTKATFDADDNMIGWGDLKLTYDSRNRLVKANGVSYVYDAQNNRLSKTVDGKKTTYITNPYAPLSQVLVKTDADGSKTYYVYGLGLLSQTKGSETLYYHYDLRGSTIALSSDDKDFPAITDRFAYLPYGKLISHTGSHDTPFLFVGKYGVMKEENNLYYMRARYYHDILRRFVNRDTLLGEIGDFGSLNRFGYVKGNPAIGIDPKGHFIQFIVIAAIYIGLEIYAAEPVYAPSNEDVKNGELFRKGQEDYERRRAIADIGELGLGASGVLKGVCKVGFKRILKTTTKEIEKSETNYITKREFKGRLTIQNDTLIDRNYIDNNGRNFIERMEEGLAPIGKDGKPIEIHHSRQEDKIWIEMLHETHNVNSKVLHRFKQSSVINRQEFEKLRKEYWKERALDFSSDF